jgi:hypothetical protein
MKPVQSSKGKGQSGVNKFIVNNLKLNNPTLPFAL